MSMTFIRNICLVTLSAFVFLLLTLLMPQEVPACGGTDVILSDNPARDASGQFRSKDGVSFVDPAGNLLMDSSAAKISPERAQQIAEKFVAGIKPTPPFPLVFRKLEWVHGKLIYQFQSAPVKGYNGKYHLGPVNFIVDRLVLDVDAMTGDLHLANGCGAAPGQLLYVYNPDDFMPMTGSPKTVFVSNNTNFIARMTNNAVKIDGVIDPAEWQNTGHKYFYLGDYFSHKPSEPHKKAFYYAEVWTQIDDKNIYFAVKTDTPYWLALMFKDDPNLGMLGAYRDAKVFKSEGTIDDRYFMQRPDKTFFLEKDSHNDIVSWGVRQGDFYTYEVSIPLKPDDPNDVSFEEGKAYNMLLVIGNTLDHYGIFTLDEAHANHDHSKHNKAHADVWASNEETLRIGTAADRDIFGAPVKPVLAQYDSGLDPSKGNLHFHYSSRTLNDFDSRSVLTLVIAIIAAIAGFGSVLYMLWRFRSVPGTGGEGSAHGRDLFSNGLMRHFLRWKYFRQVFIIPTLLVFIAIVVLGIIDIQDGRKNISTIYTWSIWWSLIIFSFILLGRFWCMMCPFAALGDLAQKIVSLNRRLPGWLHNMGLQTLAFILLTLAFTLMMFDSKPLITAAVIMGILAAAVIFSIVYERRSFCRNICPIGAIIGLYSAVSPLELGPVDKACCDAHKSKTCASVCPMLERPENNADAVYCNFCMKCVTACPSSNLTVRMKPPGSQILGRNKRSLSEALASLLLLGVIIVETLAMTSVWQPFKDGIAAWSGIGTQGLVYVIAFGVVVAVPIVVFYLICFMLKFWMGNHENRTNDIVTEFALIFIPVGISIHLAHNIQHLLIEGPMAVPATLRFIENLLGGSSFFVNWNPAPIVGLKPLFFIQMTVIIAGFFFTLFILYRFLRRFAAPIRHIYKMMTAMSLYALVIILSGIYMLGLPMSSRHIH